MRKALVIGTAAVAAATAACGQSSAQSGGPATQQQYSVGAFHSIDVAGPYEVEVRTGSAVSVSASGPSELLERMIVTVKDGHLQIHSRKERGFDWNGSRGTARVQVTAPMLRAAAIAGSGGIQVDRIKGDRFEGSVAGSGDLRLQRIDVQSLKLSIAGSGNVEAGQGQAQAADYSIAGSGGIETSAVRTGTASISIAGSGRVNGQATGSADVSIMGSGDVRLTGGAKCTISRMGSGDVTCS